MYHIFFIHLPISEHLGCCHVLAITNSAVMNTGVHVSFQNMIFTGCIPRSRITGSYHSYISSFFFFFFFKDTPYCSPLWLQQITFPPTMQEGALFSIASPAFIVYRILDDDHPDWCEVIPHCSFDFNFSIN